MKIFILLIVCLLSIISNLNAQNWKEIAQAFPEKSMALTQNSFYGKSIDIDGDYAIIGASNYSTVLYYNGTDWIKLAELSSSDRQPDFGKAVSISGDVIVVGSNGKAYVFQKPITGWVDTTEDAILSATNSSAPTFGFSVSISGDDIIVGNHSYNNNIGCAYIYSKPTNGWSNMTQTAILSPTGGIANDYFGFSVDLSGDVAVVGMPSKQTAIGTQGTGKAMVFTKPTTGWTDAAGTILLNSSDAATKDQLGFSVSIYGDYIVLGAPYAGLHGQAYVYKKALGGWNSSNEVAILQQRVRPLDTIPTQTILFGLSVNIVGDNILVGGYDFFADYNISGFAYVFTKPNIGWQDTTETARLTTINNKTFNYFGATTGIYGDHILVGASHYGLQELSTSQLGAVYSYKVPTTGWVDTTESALHPNPIRLQAYNNKFGNAVDIDGNYAVISASGFSNNRGRVSLYHYNGTSWTLQAYLLSSDSTSSFGHSVSISGDYIAVGAPLSKVNNIQQGAVYLYQKPTSGWSNTTETAKLIASDGAFSDNFGVSVSIFGDELVVGAHRKDDLGMESGAAYIFIKPSTGWTNGVETAKLLASDASARKNFGAAVDIDGSQIVISAPSTSGFGTSSSTGSVYVFAKPTTGWMTMNETAKLGPSDGILDGYFGVSISLSGDHIAIGAKRDNQNGVNAGAVYLFNKPTSGWINSTEDAKLSPSDGATNDNFGQSIAMSENKVIVGAPWTDDLGLNSGSIYTFIKSNTAWISATEDTKTFATDGLSNDNFGIAIALSEDYMLVGASNKSEVDFGAGAAYLFKSCPITIIDTSIASGSSILVGTHTYTNTGTYRDTFPTQDCDSIVVTNLTVGLSIQQTSEEYDHILSLYPNPSTGLITVELSPNYNQKTIEIEVFNPLGKLVYYKKGQGNTLNLETLSKGLYLLRVNQKYSQSFILSNP